MDNKDPNNSSQFGNPLNWKSLGFFSAEDYLIYIFKKTEKITSALYLVSGLLKDNEPLKWELRDRGMGLLSSSFIASSSMPGDKSSTIQSLFSSALETLSILNVAKISNLITDMNYKLLVREIDGIVSLLKDRLAQNAENAGYVLSESFFRTPDLFSSGFKNASRSNTYNTSSVSDRSVHPSGLSNKAKLKDSASTVDTRVKKSQRQEVIVSLLQKNPSLTIKDFSKIIKDCSEKTIQRELSELVAQNVIKKEGERRWSRYSLK